MYLALTQVSTQGKPISPDALFGRYTLVQHIHDSMNFSHMIRPHPGQYSMPGYHDPMGFASPFTTGNFYLIIKRTNKLIAIRLIKKGLPAIIWSILREYKLHWNPLFCRVEYQTKTIF